MHTLNPTSHTQAVLLLCGRFGGKNTGTKPLSLREYNALALWLHGQGMQPTDLLDRDGEAAASEDPFDFGY